MSFKHGYACHPKKTVEYRAWISMKARCYNPSYRAFHNYGGRGIIVCDRWLNDFEAFLCDMDHRPEGKTSLGRIDNDGNYEPLNCEWQTGEEQQQNSSKNKLTKEDVREIRWLYEGGFTHKEIARKFDINRRMVGRIVNYEAWMNV
jgi:hypothetical protein